MKTLVAIFLSIALIVTAACARDTPRVLVRGNIKHVKLFCLGDDCKFLVALKIESVKQVGTVPLSGLPKVGEIITFDAEDSRVNLYVRQEGSVCTEDKSVKVCTYVVEEGMEVMTAIVWESIGSSGLPEYIGVPK